MKTFSTLLLSPTQHADLRARLEFLVDYTICSRADICDANGELAPPEALEEEQRVAVQAASECLGILEGYEIEDLPA